MLDSSLAKSELGWDNSSDINQDLFSIISGYKLILESPEDVLEYCKSEIMQRITHSLMPDNSFDTVESSQREEILPCARVCF